MVKRAKSLVHAAKAEMPGFIKPQLATLKMKALAGAGFTKSSTTATGLRFTSTAAPPTRGHDTGVHGYVQ
ncbi:hypothetical protein ACVW1A_004973 [Bradyrhizobium sp. LB1.3]